MLVIIYLKSIIKVLIKEKQMDSNVYNELLFVLQNNEITKLPSTKFISENKEIALAVWGSFKVEQDYYQYASFEDWYATANWKEVLSSYKEDISFWKEAIKNTTFKLETILSNDSFKTDFPIICKALIEDNDLLLEMFNDNTNKSLIDLMTIPENDKDRLYKAYYLKDPYSIDGSSLLKYQSDKDFTKGLLKVHPQLYLSLTQENKSNNEYIDIALKKQPSLFRYLPSDKKEQYFPTWLEDNINNNININYFSLNQKREIFAKRPDLLVLNLDQSEDFAIYKDVAIKIIQADFDKNIGYFNSWQLRNLFKEKEDFVKIQPMLENFVDNYSNKQFSKKDEKIFEIIFYEKTLKEKVENNLFFQINRMSPQKKITLEVFHGYFINIQDKVNNEELPIEKANAVLVRLKNKLPTDVLVKERYPENNLYDFLNGSTVSNKLKM